VPENESNPAEPTGNSDPNSVDEAEIDRILAEASGLTGQIGDEVGVDSTAGAGIDALQGSPGPTDVDSQVNRVEELLRGVASGDVSEPVAPPSGPAFDAVPPHEGADRSAEQASDIEPPADVDDTSSVPPTVEPDTQPVDPAPEVTEQTEDRSADSNSATADGSSDDSEPVSGDAGPIESEPDPEQPSIPPSAESTAVQSAVIDPEGTGESTTSESNHAKPESTDEPPIESCARGTDRGNVATAGARVFANSAHRVRDGAGRVLAGILDALDVIDTRCAWISYTVRRTIGWIAFALLVAACSITAYSLF